MEREAVAKQLVAQRGKLLAYLWSLLRDPSLAEDLYQEVLISAMQHAEGITDDDHLLAWARRTARHRAIDHLRRHQSQPLLLQDDVLDLLESHWDKVDASPQARRIEALAQCLPKLTRYARSLVEMRFSQGRSGIEIAESLGREPHTIYTALSRAYRTLGDCVKRQLAQEEA